MHKCILYGCAKPSPGGNEGSAAGGGRSDLSDVRPQAPCKRATARRAALGESLWQRPRCSALPVADKAEHKCVPGSIADAADLSARKISGTPNGKSD